jgi:DivIVA domain-containing protein
MPPPSGVGVVRCRAMAVSFTRPDPSSPSSVSSASFTQSRKGFDQSEVRDFLRMVAAELARLQERERFLERELRTQQHLGAPSSVALDDDTVTRMLGEEAARILQAAREAASQIKIRAEDGAGRLLREATDEAQRLREEAEIEASRRRQDAASDAEAELQMAKQQGRDMVNEARAYRERMLGEMARRREVARQQIEQLVHGRDRLLQAFERARLVSMDVMAELTPLGEPTEYVDLSPTTGPVPLMVKGSPRPGSAAAPQTDEPSIELDAADVAAGEPEPPERTDDDPTVAGHDVEAVTIDDEVAPPIVVEPEDEFVDELEVESVDDVETSQALDDDTVVMLDITPAHDLDHVGHDDREPAPVVSLFGDPEPSAAAAPEVTAPAEAVGTTTATKAPIGDLFARLRAEQADDIAARVAKRTDTDSVAIVDAEVDPTNEAANDAANDAANEAAKEAAPATAITVGGDDSVFHATPEAPVEVRAAADTPFGRRDEALTPLIVNAARKLKRVLADEQNDVLHALRGNPPVRTVEALLATADTQRARYADAISSELVAAAIGGAMSMGMKASDAQREMKRSDALSVATTMLAAEVIDPLRLRIERCVADADGDNTELANLARAVYREWKSQRIDEHLDDVARTAYGRGALAGVTAGTKVCWLVDPAGPPCADAEDNALAGPISAGDAFPTDHTTAPAHPGCRCVIAPA